VLDPSFVRIISTCEYRCARALAIVSKILVSGLWHGMMIETRLGFTRYNPWFRFAFPASLMLFLSVTNPIPRPAFVISANSPLKATAERFDQQPQLGCFGSHQIPPSEKAARRHKQRRVDRIR
jgi:hypothetical protein